MIAKTFEVRNDGTFIPVLAIKLVPETEGQRYLLARAGYGKDFSRQSQYVILIKLSTGQGTYDPYVWRKDGTRTLFIAHQHILQRFSYLMDGDVIDVEYILDITKEPKISESVCSPA